MNTKDKINYLKQRLQELATINGIPYFMKKERCVKGILFFFQKYFLNMRLALAAFLSLDDLRLHATEQGVARTLVVDIVLRNKKAVQQKRNLRGIAKIPLYILLRNWTKSTYTRHEFPKHQKER